MFWNLVIVALIGAAVGGAARLFYPGREPTKIVGTVILGLVGALLGALLSWAFWPEVGGQIATEGLLMSMVGAVIALVLWAGVSYARRIGGQH